MIASALLPLAVLGGSDLPRKHRAETPTPRESMRILAIDPGPERCGLVIYDTEAGEVAQCDKAATVDAVITLIRYAQADHGVQLIACERVQSYGIAGASLLRTSEVYGRVLQATEAAGLPFVGRYRREVLSLLMVAGRGNRDAMVRERMLEMHGGSRSAACGTKRAPGPLYGVTSHAWQALGLAMAVIIEIKRGDEQGASV